MSIRSDLVWVERKLDRKARRAYHAVHALGVVFLGLWLVAAVVIAVSGSDAMGQPATVGLLFLIVGLAAMQMGYIHALAWVVRTQCEPDRPGTEADAAAKPRPEPD